MSRPPRLRSLRARRLGILGRIRLAWAIWRMQRLADGGTEVRVVGVGETHLQHWKGNAKFYALLTTGYWSAGRWADCVSAARRSLALEPNQRSVLIFLLSAVRSTNQAELGIDTGERWLARFGPNAEISRHLSFLYDDLDRGAEALACAQKGLAAGPDDVRLASVTAHYLAKVEGSASALRFAEPYREKFAADFYCENTLAEGLAAAGDHAAAEQIFAAMHARNPKDARAFAALLNVKIQLGRAGEVLAAIEKWRRTELLTAPLANEAGRSLLELGRPAEALEWMRRATQLAPAVEKYADNFAVVLGKAGQHAECVAECERRLTRASPASRLKLLTTLAIAQTELRRHDAALASYQQAARENPRNGEAVTNVLVGFNWLERHADSVAFAKTQTNAGVELPVRFWSEFAWACHQAGDRETETSVLREWRRAAPDDPHFVRATIRHLNALKQPDAALTFAREWSASHPDHAGGWRYLAEQEHVCGHDDAELSAMETATRLGAQDGRLADYKLTVLRRRGQIREALAWGEAWIAQHPDRVYAELVNRLGLLADDLERWPEAEQHYRRAHELDPAGGVWAGNLIRAQIMQRRHDEAIALGRRWLEQHGMEGYVVGKVAWALREVERRSEETVLLRQGIAAGVGDEELLYDLFGSLLAQNETDAAKAVLDGARERGFLTGRFLNDWGNHLRELEKFPEAEAAYRQALELNPESQTAAGNLAALFTLCHRTAEARALCLEWLNRRPDDLYVRRQLAHACYTADEIADAEPEYRRLLAHDPGSLFLTGRLAACLRLVGRHEEVLALANAWLAQQPGDAFLHTEAGIACSHLKQTDEAMKHYDRALALEPAWYGAAVRKMRLLDERGDLHEAVVFGSAWAAEHEPDADFQNELAILLDRAGKTDQAEQRFRRAIELDDRNPTMAGNAVEILCRRDQITESIQLGQRLLAKGPPNAYFLRRLAEAYSRNHEHLPALDLLDSADVLEPEDADVAKAYLRIARDGDEAARGIAFARTWLARAENKDDAAVWAQLGRLLFHADEESAAFEAVDQARRLEPNEIRHTALRFSLLNASGDTSRLIAEYQKLREEWRQDSVLMNYASQAYLDLGLEDEALALAVQNTDANPGDGEVAAWLASLHRKRDRPQRALDWIKRWTATHGDHFALVQVRAGIALDQGRHDEALADAESLLAEDRSDEDAFVLRIRALRALGRTDEARKYLHQWIEHEKLTSQVSRLLEDDSPTN